MAPASQVAPTIAPSGGSASKETSVTTSVVTSGSTVPISVTARPSTSRVPVRSKLTGTPGGKAASGQTRMPLARRSKCTGMEVGPSCAATCTSASAMGAAGAMTTGPTGAYGVVVAMVAVDGPVTTSPVAQSVAVPVHG